MRKVVSLVMIITMSISMIALPGCGSSNEPIKPDKFAPPPQKGDEMSSDKG